MRLIVVSNRLPFTVERGRKNLVEFKPSAGGLATGLSSYLEGQREAGTDLEALWVGWPGVAVPNKERDAIRTRALAEYRAYPVFVAEKEMDVFYHGFCNSVLWPLFHYFTSYARFEDAGWPVYQKINKAFAQALEEILEPGDVVWVHDYHLMLLPRLLRQSGLDLRIGFFLHIPFPSPDVFRLMPSAWATQIVDGLLGADVVGFHTASYARNFEESARVLLPPEQLDELEATTVAAYPMGIDVPRFRDAVDSPLVTVQRQRLAALTRGLKLILSIDRLDYSKGILNRLRAYELFLERYPEWQGKIVMSAIVIPSRVAVEHYGQLKRQIDEAVGRINGNFGRFDWMPIQYQYRSLSNDELVALYATADLALVTPVRDGMNLIAKEYVATRAGGPGALILSELAGAVDQLGEGAIVVSPNDIEAMAEAIKGALDEPLEDQAKRNQGLLKGLVEYDVNTWARRFLEDLEPGLVPEPGDAPGS